MVWNANGGQAWRTITTSTPTNASGMKCVAAWKKFMASMEQLGSARIRLNKCSIYTYAEDGRSTIMFSCWEGANGCTEAPGEGPYGPEKLIECFCDTNLCDPQIDGRKLLLELQHRSGSDLRVHGSISLFFLVVWKAMMMLE